MKDITANISLGRAFWLFNEPLPGQPERGGDLPEGAEIVGTFSTLALIRLKDGTYEAGTRGATVEVDQEEVREALAAATPALATVRRNADRAQKPLASRVKTPTE